MGLFAKLKSKFARRKEKEGARRYVAGLSKSRRNFGSRLDALAKGAGKPTGAYFERLEEILIEADVGVKLALWIVEDVASEAKRKKIEDPKEINELLVDRMFLGYAEKGNIENEIAFRPSGPTVLLIAGVNGSGKTTSIAKLAYRYIKRGKRVMLCAADTFRAGAREQLSVWAERLKCPIVTGKAEADPASVAFEGARRAKEENVDLLIVDTAGRLQNKVNLMRELGKIARVLNKEIEGAPHESFLVIDATTGQNGLIQAREFLNALPLTGIVMAKLDGTSKGGIVLAVRDEIGLPVRFVGLGEKLDDLAEFDLDSYLYGLLLGEEK